MFCLRAKNLGHFLRAHGSSTCLGLSQQARARLESAKSELTPSEREGGLRAPPASPTDCLCKLHQDNVCRVSPGGNGACARRPGLSGNIRSRRWPVFAPTRKPSRVRVCDLSRSHKFLVAHEALATGAPLPARDSLLALAAGPRALYSNAIARSLARLLAR